jgi:hypothetical protein
VRAVGDDQEVQHMEEGYTQLGTVLTDQRQANSEGDRVIVVGRFKGDPYDGVQLSYDAGRRNLYLTARGRCAWHYCLRRRSRGISTSGRDHTRTRWTNARAVSATSLAAVDDVRDSGEFAKHLDA